MNAKTEIQKKVTVALTIDLLFENEIEFESFKRQIGEERNSSFMITQLFDVIKSTP
jgi:hypothetical protein